MGSLVAPLPFGNCFKQIQTSAQMTTTNGDDDDCLSFQLKLFKDNRWAEWAGFDACVCVEPAEVVEFNK